MAKKQGAASAPVKAATPSPFAQLANKTPAKNGKSKTPEVNIPALNEDPKAPVIDCAECEGKGKHPMPTGLRGLMRAISRNKDLEGFIKEKQAEFYPLMQDARIGVCRSRHEYHGSVRVNGLATFITKFAYSATEVGQAAEVLAVLMAALNIQGKDEKEREEKGAAEMQKRFTTQTVVTIKNQKLLDDPAFQAKLIALCGSENLDIKMALKPTEQFHESAALDPKEEQVMKALIEAKLIKPHAPSVRQSGD